jgi:hypothetical protein
MMADSKTSIVIGEVVLGTLIPPTGSKALERPKRLVAWGFVGSRPVIIPT